MRLDPSNPSLCRNLSKLYDRTGDVRKALELSERSLRMQEHVDEHNPVEFMSSSSPFVRQQAYNAYRKTGAQILTVGEQEGGYEARLASALDITQRGRNRNRKRAQVTTSIATEELIQKIRAKMG